MSKVKKSTEDYKEKRYLMGTKPQEYRWIIIDKMIREGNYPNNRIIAEKLEVSRKTIQRDIDFLRYMKDAPIAYDKSKKGYYYSEKSYKLPAINIKEGDLFAVYIASKVVEQYKNTPLYDNLVKIYKQLQSSITEEVAVNPDWIDSNITIVIPETTTINRTVWEKISSALRAKNTVVFRYKLIFNQKAIGCKVDPYHLIGYKGDWYLIGYNHGLKNFRTYALSRIERIRITDESFTRRDFNLSEHFNQNFGIFNSSERFKVRMLFDRDVAGFIKNKEWHPSQKIIQRPDGNIELILEVNNLIEIKNWILSWGSKVKVLEPKKLVDEIKKELMGALCKYK